MIADERLPEDRKERLRGLLLAGDPDGEVRTAWIAKECVRDIYLTRDLFSFERDPFGKVRLKIGGKKYNIGFLAFKAHSDFKEPNSLYIRKERGQYFVSFCYEDGLDNPVFTPEEHLEHLRGMTAAQLQEIVVGLDRGISIPVHSGDAEFDFSKAQKNHLSKADRYIKRLQRKLARQQKGSNRRAKTKHRIATHHAKKANIRADFAHKTSRSLVDSDKRVFVLEKLNLKSLKCMRQKIMMK